jgi:Protein of unknown function (DUF3830)
MTRYFEFTLPDEAIVARALLLELEAPQTVEALWRRAPFEGRAGHAIFSGTTCALYIDPAIVIPMENATTLIQTGDLMFTHYDASTRHGYPAPLSEIYWAYDRYCRPTMPGAMLPVYPNVFGRFVEPFAAFFEASRRIRDEGRKALHIAAIEA